MSELGAVLDAVRAAPAATSLDLLARRLKMSRDDLDAALGYWVHLGELVVEELPNCASTGCGGCPLSTGRGCGQALGDALDGPRRRAEPLVIVRPAR